MNGVKIKMQCFGTNFIQIPVCISSGAGNKVIVLYLLFLFISLNLYVQTLSRLCYTFTFSIKLIGSVCVHLKVSIYFLPLPVQM